MITRLQRIVAWLRTGYPHGIPERHYLPLVALLGRRLSDDETRELGERLVAGGARLDAGQSAAVAALAGDRPLAVVEGAAGAGKTTTLAVTRTLLHDQGRQLLVVTPTLKAAKVAAAEVGAAAGSAA